MLYCGCGSMKLWLWQLPSSNFLTRHNEKGCDVGIQGIDLAVVGIACLGVRYAFSPCSLYSRSRPMNCFSK